MPIRTLRVDFRPDVVHGEWPVLLMPMLLLLLLDSGDPLSLNIVYAAVPGWQPMRRPGKFPRRLRHGAHFRGGVHCMRLVPVWDSGRRHAYHMQRLPRGSPV